MQVSDLKYAEQCDQPGHIIKTVKVKAGGSVAQHKRGKVVVNQQHRNPYRYIPGYSSEVSQGLDGRLSLRSLGSMFFGCERAETCLLLASVY